MNRVKHTSIVDGVTRLISAKNSLISVGPDHDPHRDVVTLCVTYHPPIAS